MSDHNKTFLCLFSLLIVGMALPCMGSESNDQDVENLCSSGFQEHANKNALTVKTSTSVRDDIEHYYKSNSAEVFGPNVELDKAVELVVARKKFRRSVLTLGYSFHILLPHLKESLESTQTLTTWVYASHAQMAKVKLSKENIRSNLPVLEMIYDEMQDDFRDVVNKKIDIAERRSLWRKIVRAKYKAADIFESFQIREKKIKEIYTQAILFQNDLKKTSSLKGDQQSETMIKILDTPKTLVRKLSMIKPALDSYEGIRNEFVVANLRLVVSIVKKNLFKIEKKYQKQEVLNKSFDLVSESNLALFRALEDYLPAKMIDQKLTRIKFSTYAVHWINRQILEWFYKDYSMIHVSRKALDSNFKREAFYRELESNLGRQPNQYELRFYFISWKIKEQIKSKFKKQKLKREPTDQEIRSATILYLKFHDEFLSEHGQKPSTKYLKPLTGFTVIDETLVDKAYKAKKVDSIEFTNGDGQTTDHTGILSDADDFDSIDSETEVMQELFQLAFASLTEREQTVIKMRFGLGGGEHKTLNEVGVHLGGLSKERIRQIETKVLLKMSDKKFGLKKYVNPDLNKSNQTK